MQLGMAYTRLMRSPYDTGAGNIPVSQVPGLLRGDRQVCLGSWDQVPRAISELPSRPTPLPHRNRDSLEKNRKVAFVGMLRLLSWPMSLCARVARVVPKVISV